VGGGDRQKERVALMVGGRAGDFQTPAKKGVRMRKKEIGTLFFWAFKERKKTKVKISEKGALCT